MNNTISKIATPKINVELLIRLAAFCVLWGRAWEHWFFSPPVHAVFWNYDLMGWFIEGVLDISWNDWLTTPEYDPIIIGIQHGMGCIYGITGTFCLAYNGRVKIFRVALLVSAGLLVVLAAMEMMDKFNATGQFFEHSSQIMAPFLLFLMIWKPEFNKKKLILILKVVIALTFIAHGLYAIGFYKQPSIFIKMIRGVTGLSYESSASILRFIGFLDIVGGLCLFYPNELFVKIVLGHLIVWGFITAFGRILGITNWDQFDVSFGQLWYQTCYRLPHGFLPLALFGLLSIQHEHILQPSRKRQFRVKFPRPVKSIKS